MALITPVAASAKTTRTPAARVQRACACGKLAAGDKCESCKKNPLQRKAASTARGAPIASVSVDPRLISGGMPLPATLRGALESHFPADFSRVRLHKDALSHQAAQEVDAQAFTLGSHVHFAHGRYRPDQRSGLHLLAHELTHTLQQGDALPSPADQLPVDGPDTAAEREADRHAARVTDAFHAHPPGAGAHGAAAADLSPPGIAGTSAPRVQRVGFGQFLARLFAEGTFSDKELSDYLQYLDDNARIEGNYDSDNKARVIIRRWRKDPGSFKLTLARKQLLLQELIDGPTLDDDEHAILELLRGSSVSEVASLVAAAGGEESLKSEFQGSESDELDSFLAQWHGQQTGGAAGRRGTSRGADRIVQVVVTQTTPQTVVAHFGDGHTEGDICSSGKGTCCVEPGSDQSPSVADTRRNDSNWTPVGEHTVYFKEPLHGHINWWMQFNTRAIALHEYAPVDGTPLSHGCVRLNPKFAKRIYPAVMEHVTKVVVKDVPRPRCNHAALKTEWEQDFMEAAVDDGERPSPETLELIKHMKLSLGAGATFKDRLRTQAIPRCPGGRAGARP
jgi:hypothetical protein